MDCSKCGSTITDDLKCSCGDHCSNCCQCSATCECGCNSK